MVIHSTQPLRHVHCMGSCCTSSWPTHTRTHNIGYANRRERRFCLLDNFQWCCRPKQRSNLVIICDWVSRAMKGNKESLHTVVVTMTTQYTCLVD